MPEAERWGWAARAARPSGEFRSQLLAEFPSTSRFVGPLNPPARAIGPAEVLEAVEAMDDAQRARLAELLGVEARHPFLYLPGRSGLVFPAESHFFHKFSKTAGSSGHFHRIIFSA